MPWQVEQVLADVLPLLSSVDIFAAEVEPKMASLILRQLNLCAPLTSLKHVKRIRKIICEDGVELSIILCLAPSGSREWSSKNAPLEVSSLVQEYKLIPFVTTVPQHEACSREEWEEQCRLWPTSYHPNAVRLLHVINFEENERNEICRLMRVAILQAQLAVKAGQHPAGAAIVDSSTGLVVSVGHDETGGWMNATCNLKPREEQLNTYNNHSDDNTPARSIREKNCSWHPLRHAVMVAIERAAERNKGLKPEHSVICGNGGKPNTKGLSEYLQIPSNESNQYLCTGFDAYMTHEPCAMCAMALLHQRVRRVFYGIPNLKIGALGGLYKLHCLQGLNHHYSVFRVAFSEADLMKS